MSPSRSSAVLVPLALALSTAAIAAPPASFQITPGLVEPSPAGLRLRFQVGNVGPTAASDLQVRGEILGERAVASVSAPVAPGAAAEVVLDLPRVVTTPGLHALAVRLDYECLLQPGGPREPFSQWAYVTLAFGPSPPAAVHVDVPRVRFAETGRLQARLRSADGRAHRVRLTVHVPRALGVVPQRQVISVPARGDVAVPVRLFRGTSGTQRHGVLALAVTEGEEVATTAVATGLVEVGPDPALLPRLGRRLPILSGALLLAAVVAQWRRPVLRSPTV